MSDRSRQGTNPGRYTSANRIAEANAVAEAAKKDLAEVKKELAEAKNDLAKERKLREASDAKVKDFETKLKDSSKSDKDALDKSKVDLEKERKLRETAEAKVQSLTAELEQLKATFAMPEPIDPRYLSAAGQAKLADYEDQYDVLDEGIENLYKQAERSKRRCMMHGIGRRPG